MNKLLHVINKGNNYFFRTTIMLSIIFLVLFLNHYYKSTKNDITKEQYKPQEYMQSLNVTQFTIDGKIKDNILAEHWKYIPNKKISELQKPKLTVIKKNGAIWTVTAKYGKALQESLESKIDKLELYENVIIHRPKAYNIAPITITTEQLNYFKSTEYVTTKEFVKMEKPGLLITGTGLEGYLNKSWIKICKNVTTKYQKNI